MRTVVLSHDYPVPPEAVWNIATDLDALQDAMKGIIAFEGVPSGKVFTGQKMNVMVSLFGKLPKQPYFMEVLECDDANMVLRSSEKGVGVKSWKHTLTVTPTETGSRLTDSIEIDAGMMTPVFAWWAKFMYAKRHQPRLQMLGLQ